MSEPTSGEWTIKEGFYHTAEIWGGEDKQGYRKSIATVHNAGPNERGNAQLIAAAPELYEAASYLLAHEDADPGDNLDQDTYSEAWEFLKEAVAKVEGRKAT